MTNNKTLYKPAGIPLKHIYVVPGEPALYLDKQDAVVINDLHLGFEEALARGLDYSDKSAKYFPGMIVPRIQLKKIKESLTRIHRIIKPRKIIINGDIKHAFDRLLRQERREVRELLEYIMFDLAIKEIILIRGNHDNYLRLLLKDYGLELLRDLEIELGGETILLTHGHIDVDISDYDAVIIGHEHPSLRCFGTYKFPSFLFIPTRRDNYVIVVPAMGPYQSGTTITPVSSEYLSPIIRKYCIVEHGKPISWIPGESDRFAKKVFNSQILSIASELLILKEYSVEGRSIFIVDFADITTAMILCGV
ncbi:MAG: metallophosphoesterase [Crenarchaeota archaeon]|nr:metallophosphoesterase [Thermoproteota archaeon]